MKKTYSTPQLIVHGNLARLTESSNAMNRDTPTGPANTAWPNPPCS